MVGSYQAVPEYALQSEFALPMFLATRDVNNYWDTEIVVHNVSSSETVRVTFEWSADNAPAWANNNYADLLPNERRIFLASQLMYATGANGTLIEKNYWAWAKVRAFLYPSGSPRNIAVTTNVFKSVVEGGKPKAEKGSVMFAQFEMPRASTGLVIPGFTTTGTAYESKIRISNPGTWTSNFTIKLYNSSGTQVGNTYSNSVANGTSRQVDGTALGVANGTYTARIASDYSLVAAYMTKIGGGHYGGTAQAVGDTNGYVRMPYYWSNYWSWDDRTTLTNIGSSATFYTNLYARTTGSYQTGSSSTVATNAIRNVNHASVTNVELYGFDYPVPSADPTNIVKLENYSATEDRVMAYNGIAVLDNVWYVPFAPAPVVQFGWQTTAYSSTLPGPHFGVSGSVANLPNYVKDLNHYEWGDAPKVGWDWQSTRAKHNEVAPGTSQNRFMDMFFGLGGTAMHGTAGQGGHYGIDCVSGSCNYNSATRLGAIRNTIPSNAPGSPLLLGNEPDHLDQGTMTYAEMTRMIFIFRAWPGDLYSPAFGDLNFNDGQGRYDDLNPIYGNIPGLDDYFDDTGRIVSGQSWSMWNFLDGLAMHFYPPLSEIATDPNNNSTAIKNILYDGWRYYASGKGIPIIVTEYSVHPDTATTAEIAARMCSLRVLLQDKLGGYSAGNYGNPFKLFWFISQGSGMGYWDKDVLFDSAHELTSPVGEAWEADHGAHNGALDHTTCP